MGTKAIFRLLAQKMKAAKDVAFYEKLQKEFTPEEVNCFVAADCLIFDGNLEAVTKHMEDKGWKQDGRDSERYTCMTKGKESVRLDMDENNTNVILRTAPQNPDKVEATLILKDPSDLLTDPQIGDSAILPENELSIGDSRPAKTMNNGQPPSIPVSGGGAGGGGSGAVLPSPNPEGETKIQRRLRRLQERRTGNDQDHAYKDSDREDEFLEEPGEPTGNQAVPEPMSDSPIFMSDQPWGYTPNAPMDREDLLNIQEVDPKEDENSDITLTDVPIGSPEGSRPMPTGDKYMASAATRIRTAKG